VLGPVSQQPLQLVRHRELELIYLTGVISAERTLKLLRPHIERREMKRVIVAHGLRSPNSTVPSLIIVAPSSTAIG
jgi:hypothetical protein